MDAEIQVRKTAFGRSATVANRPIADSQTLTFEISRQL